jgi:hypothetical protein
MFKLFIAAATLLGLIFSFASVDGAWAWSPRHHATCSPWNGDGSIGVRACQPVYGNSRYGELIVQAFNRTGGNVHLEVKRCMITAGGTTYGLNANGKNYFLAERGSATVARSGRWQMIPLGAARVVCAYDLKSGFN